MLDFALPSLKSSYPVFPLHSNRYAEWRRHSGLAWSLHEERQTPPERLLQAVWFHQRIQREQLRTLDGRGVQILHPGFWNREAGPDFRGAMVQFDGEAPRTGDIEIDLHNRALLQCLECERTIALGRWLGRTAFFRVMRRGVVGHN